MSDKRRAGDKTPAFPYLDELIIIELLSGKEMYHMSNEINPTLAYQTMARIMAQKCGADVEVTIKPKTDLILHTIEKTKSMGEAEKK